MTSGLGIEAELGDKKFILLPLITENLKSEISNGWLSPSYGVKERAPIVKYTRNVTGSTELLTLMFLL